MRALTVRQPWAGLLVAGIKDVENRVWPTRHRGPLLIHAGAASDPYGAAELPWQCELHGSILGMVRVLDCTQRFRSPWALPGQWHWVVGGARTFRQPVSAAGRLGLWTPDERLLERLPAYIRRAPR